MDHRPLLRLNVATLAALPAAALAHHEVDASGSNFESWLIVLLAASAIAYGWGVTKLWRKAGAGHGIRTVEVIRFAAGWTALAAALLSPIDGLAARSFAVHMVQHETLMVVAAPLLVLSRPFEAWAWALPPGTRSVLATMFSASHIRFAWRRLTAPATALYLHALALWIWHVPALFVAALATEALHVLQHTCFFASALVFWWAAFGRGIRAPDTTSIALLFTTMLHTSALGLLLTFAPTPWYAHPAPALFGLTALEDQQLGGLVMWVPGGVAYLVAGLVIVAAWLSPSRVARTTPAQPSRVHG